MHTITKLIANISMRFHLDLFGSAKKITRFILKSVDYTFTHFHSSQEFPSENKFLVYFFVGNNVKFKVLQWHYVKV